MRAGEGLGGGQPHPDGKWAPGALGTVAAGALAASSAVPKAGFQLVVPVIIPKLYIHFIAHVPSSQSERMTYI